MTDPKEPKDVEVDDVDAEEITSPGLKLPLPPLTAPLRPTPPPLPRDARRRVGDRREPVVEIKPPKRGRR